MTQFINYSADVFILEVSYPSWSVASLAWLAGAREEHHLPNYINLRTSLSQQKYKTCGRASKYLFLAK